MRDRLIAAVGVGAPAPSDQTRLVVERFELVRRLSA